MIFPSLFSLLRSCWLLLCLFSWGSAAVIYQDEDFETTAVGSPFSATGWTVSIGATVTDLTSATGNQSLLMPDSLSKSLVWQDASVTSDVVYVDFFITPQTQLLSELPSDVGATSTGVLAFVEENGLGVLYVVEGSGAGAASWQATGFTFAIDASGNALNWQRLVIKLDFRSRSYDVFVDNALTVYGLGFVDASQSQFQQFSLDSQLEDELYFDSFFVTDSNPLFVDNDNDSLPADYEIASGLSDTDESDREYDEGDGLTAIEEYLLGTNAGLLDSDVDLIDDNIELLFNDLDPTVSNDGIITALELLDGVWQWSTGFESEDGYVSGIALDGQEKWLASPTVVLGTDDTQTHVATADETVSMSKYFGGQDVDSIWLRFGAKFGPGSLPDQDTFAEPSAAQFFVRTSQSIQYYDGSAWQTVATTADLSQWQWYTVHLDYASEQWLLMAGSELIAYDIDFASSGSGLDQLTRFKVLLEKEAGSDQASYFDNFSVSATVPEALLGLDVDGDGLNYSTEDGFGSNPYEWDSEGDLLSDGLEYSLGTSPILSDSDGDSYDDWEEYTYTTTSPTSFSDAPTARDVLPWQAMDLGGITPSRVYTVDEEYLLYAAGDAHTGNNDEAAYFYQAVTGNFDISIQVKEFEALQNGSGVGIVARESLDTDSVFAGMFYQRTASNRYRPINRARLTTAASTTSTNFGLTYFTQHAEDRYLRLVRDGDDFTGYFSTDGISWIEGLTYTLALPDTLCLGFTHYSGNSNTHMLSRLALLQDVRDLDADGLTAEEEAMYGTSQLLADSDGDSISDYDEVKIWFTDPLVNEFTSGFTEVSTLTPSAYTASTGVWQTAGNVVYARDIRGSLTYDLSIATAGYYILEVTGSQENSFSPEDEFGLDFSIAGQAMPPERMLKAGEPLLVPLPYLTAGTHDLLIEWINGATQSYLQIDSLRLLSIDGSWDDTRIDAMTGLDENTIDSYISPFCLQGDSYTAELLTITSSFDLDPASSDDDAVAYPALYGEYYANVHLDSQADTQVAVTDQFGVVSFNKTVRWLPYDLLASTDDLLVRVNDAMLLAASQPYHSGSEAVTITLSTGEVYNQTTADAVLHSFTQAGEHSITIDYLDDSSQPATAVINITVAEVSLPSVLAVINTATRDWTVDPISSDVELVGDSRMGLLQENSRTASTAEFSVASDVDANVIARLSDGSGSILGHVPVEAVINYFYSQQPIWDIVETYSDGSELWEGQINLGGDIPDDLVITITVFKAGVTLDDGLTTRTVTAADFDANGTYTYYMIRPEGTNGSTCHRVHFYQGDQYLNAKY